MFSSKLRINLVCLGVIQFVYCCLVGTFPFNAFLSGFISCVGSFVLAVCLRLQVRVRFPDLQEINKKSLLFDFNLSFYRWTLPTRASSTRSVPRGRSPTSSSRTWCSTWWSWTSSVEKGEYSVKGIRISGTGAFHNFVETFKNGLDWITINFVWKWELHIGI